MQCGMRSFRALKGRSGFIVQLAVIGTYNEWWIGAVTATLGA